MQTEVNKLIKFVRIKWGASKRTVYVTVAMSIMATSSFMLLVSGCSSVLSRSSRAPQGSYTSGHKELAQPRRSEYVPRAEYDELLSKYEKLASGASDSNSSPTSSPNSNLDFNSRSPSPSSSPAINPGTTSAATAVSIPTIKSAEENSEKLLSTVDIDNTTEPSVNGKREKIVESSAGSKDKSVQKIKSTPDDNMDLMLEARTAITGKAPPAYLPLKDKNNGKRELASVDNNLVENGQEENSKVESFSNVGSVDSNSEIDSELKLPAGKSVDDKLEQEVHSLKLAIELMKKGHYGKAINILRPLESSTFKQIKVRAKFELGEILFMQKEYDLALQTFEDIILKYAFSGLTIKSLQRLTVCCSKLSLKEKYDKYSMLLNNFFISGSS